MREKFCYCQDVDEILRTWEASLRALFREYALGDGAIGDELRSTKLLDYEVADPSSTLP